MADLITVAQLAAVMPHGAAAGRLVPFLGPLNRGCREFDIMTPARLIGFLPELAHESGEFRYVREIADGSAYEGRRDLGNTQPGDGKRFCGRGLIQITGRANYARVGQALGIDCIAQPELLEFPENATRSACWFWRHGNGDLNPLADRGDWTLIRRRINGGLNGLDACRAYRERAKRVFAAAVAGPTVHLIKRGAWGQRVRDLQAALNGAGITPALKADGDYGPATEAAVREYQRRKGLQIDGVAGPQTLSALGL